MYMLYLRHKTRASSSVTLARARNRSLGWQTILLLAPLLISCRKITQTVQVPATAGGELRPYPGALEPDDGQWVRATKDYTIPAIALLRRLNTENVANLRVAWTSIPVWREDKKLLRSLQTTRCILSRPGRTHCMRLI
jgi:glucose dehydrogenase